MIFAFIIRCDKRPIMGYYFDQLFFRYYRDDMEPPHISDEGRYKCWSWL